MSLDNRIKESYRSAQIPQIDLERKIVNQLKLDKKSNKKLNLRTVMITCMITLLMTSVVFAISRIIVNDDGSHTLIGDNEEAVWTMRPNSDLSHLDDAERQALKRVLNEQKYMERQADEATVLYLQYDHDKKPIFVLLPAHDRFFYSEDTRNQLEEHQYTPDYLLDVLDVMEEDFEVLFVNYQYSATPASEESILDEVMEQAAFDVVYSDVVKIEKEHFLTSFELGSKELDKLRDVKIIISTSETTTTSGDIYRVGMESMEIMGHTVLIGEMSEGVYEFAVEVNGLGFFMRANPMGNIHNMVEVTEKFIHVLESNEK